MKNTITINNRTFKPGKIYNGKRDNSERFRPLLTSRCIIPNTGSKAAKKVSVYVLINILVNKGKYDTYILKNTETGKIKRSTLIQEIKEVRTSEFTKQEVLEMIKKQPWKPARDFLEKIEKIEKNPADMETWKELILDSLCTDHTAKTEMLVSTDTSCLITCATNAMRFTSGCICGDCFSESQQEYQTPARDKLIRNAYLYCFHDIPAEAFPLLNTLYFRFECFGDLMNNQQFENYLKLARRNPRTTFTEWTKKPWIMNHVFKNTEKPENLIVILSAPKINDTMTYDDARAAWPFIDKLFTVYEKDYIKANNITINCGGNKCIECLNCYEKYNNVTHLREIKK